MTYISFHWVWYLLGVIEYPRLTIAIALSLHGHDLHIPVPAMIIVWLVAIIVDVLGKIKVER